MSMNGNGKGLFDFNTIADRYDIWYDSTEGIFYDRLEKAAIYQLLKPLNGLSGQQSRLLEVGCGTGHWSSYFASLGFAVTGVDIAEDMLNIARRRNIAGVEFIRADGGSLPFADDSFDIAVAITALEFVQNPQRVLAEMARCVGRRGWLIIGGLNRLASYNSYRAQKTGSVYSKARMFTPGELGDILEPLGETKIIVTGFAGSLQNLPRLADIANKIARLIRLQSGVFIAARVNTGGVSPQMILASQM